MKKSMNVGDKISYHGHDGEVISANNETVLVRLADGKEYILPYSDVKKTGLDIGSVPVEMTGLMQAIQPYIKNQGFLGEMANMMGRNGISELHIKSGKIAAFRSSESLEERIARYKADALKDAEKKAIADFSKDGGLAVL